MKLLAELLGLTKKNQPKTLAEYKREMYSQWGQQQFRKLNELGLNIPVSLT